MAGERVSVLSSTRFSRFSIDQANSPSSRAPTMRPLPLRVWNERRTVMSASRSSGFSSHAGKPRWILASSSCASSMKSFTSSGSACSASGGALGGRGGGQRRRRGIESGRRRRCPAGARWDLHGLRVGARLERRHRRHRGRRLLLERLHTGLGVVEHVPGIGAPGLQRLHVVLDAHDRIGETVDEARRQHVHARLHDALQLRGDALDDLHRARLAEQQQARPSCRASGPASCRGRRHRACRRRSA